MHIGVYVIGCEVTTVPIFPRTSATPGEMCTMDVGFRPDVNVPRTSSNPGEKCAGELGCRSVLGFSQVDSAQSKCGVVELDFRRANCPPGEIGAECDYIMPAPLAGSSDLECLPYQGRDCIRDLMLAGRCLRPYPTCLARGARMLLMAPVDHPGMLSSSTFMPEILVDPGGTLPPSDLAGMLLPAMPVGPVGRWGTWPPSVSDPTGPGGQSVTGGPVGHLGTLPSSTFEPAILLDPGGMSPSSDLAGMLLPAIPVSPVGFWGKLSSSDSDPVGQDGPYGADGPVGHLGTLSPSTSTYKTGGSWWDVSLVRPCLDEGSGTFSGVGSSEGPCWPCGVIRNVNSE